MATVHLPRSLVTLFPDPPPRRFELEAASVAELIGLLDASWPGTRDRLLDAGPAIREHINLFVDGHPVRELATPLTSASVVHIIPAVSGGAGALGSPARRARPGEKVAIEADARSFLHRVRPPGANRLRAGRRAIRCPPRSWP